MTSAKIKQVIFWICHLKGGFKTLTLLEQPVLTKKKEEAYLLESIYIIFINKKLVHFQIIL